MSSTNPSDDTHADPQPIAHPEVFDIRAMPPHRLPLKPGQLEEFQIRHYFEKGYLIVPDFFKKEELDACRRDIEVQVDTLARKLNDNGKIKNLYEDVGLFQRLTCIEKEFPGAVVLFLKGGQMTKAFMDLWSNERLLNVVEQLIGPEIMGHPVWNIRAKIPQNEATTVPWHQDVGYTDDESRGVLQTTAWIPFLDTNENNGCMEVISGGHRTGKVVKHNCCWGDTWYIYLENNDMEETLDVNVERDTVLCPVPYGGLLLLNNMIPHRSLNNISNDTRWSIDLRWQRADKPVGFYGIKSGVLIRSEKNPIEKIDWDSFNRVSRSEEEIKDSKGAIDSDDPFDTIIVGPWMKKWGIVHETRHTAQLNIR